MNIGGNVRGLPGLRVGALKAAKGEEGDFGLESLELSDSPDNALSKFEVADELWREDETLLEDFFNPKIFFRGMMLFL